MLQGKALAAAIVSAMELKARRDGVAKITQVELGRALDMTQPSVSELLRLGRLAKEKLPALLAYFADVVGPDHFGLPVSKFEMDLLIELRALPASAQQTILERVRAAAAAVRDASAALEVSLLSGPSSEKRRANAR